MEGIIINIRGKNLDINVLFELFCTFPKENRHGIGLLTAGTARYPHAERVIMGHVFKKPGQCLSLQELKGFRVSEKAGYADEELFKEGLNFNSIFLK